MASTPDSRQRSSLRLALAAGGTGGHIMPALAVAEAIEDIAPKVEFLFFCGSKEQELGWYRKGGFEPYPLPAIGLGRSLTARGRGVWLAWRAYLLARRKLKAWQPDAVIGLGGYVSGPTLMAASRLGFPTVIHEQNALAGKTNRWLAPRVDRIATTFPKAFPGISDDRLLVTGNPIRKAVLQPAEKGGARRHFRLDPDLPTLLVSGGSQGARSRDETLLKMLRASSIAGGDSWQALWIAGAANFDRIQAGLSELPFARHVRIFPFIEEMGLAYAAADAVLGRASGSLWEAAAWGLPVIAVPLPWSADDHQRLNARYIAAQGACEILEESDMTPESLADAIGRALLDNTRNAAMGQAALKMARPDAAQALARIVLDLAGARATPAVPA